MNWEELVLQVLDANCRRMAWRLARYPLVDANVLQGLPETAFWHMRDWFNLRGL